MLKTLQDIADLTKIQQQVAERQANVGDIYKLDLQQTQSSYLEAALEAAKMQNEITHLREKLNRLLGLCENVPWAISEQLPDDNCIDFPIECLESVAFSERLDLQAARFNVIRISQMLGIKQWWVYTQGRIGIGGERELAGNNVLGPAFAGEIPLIQLWASRSYAPLRRIAASSGSTGRFGNSGSIRSSGSVCHS
jgi:cobalt-zinc-cadmium efflux system outer membrane protein